MERGVLSAARRGKVSKKTAEAVKTLLTPALSIKATKDCDLVIIESRAVVGMKADFVAGARGVLPKSRSSQAFNLTAWLEPVVAFEDKEASRWLSNALGVVKS